MNQGERRRYLIRRLLDENAEYRGAAIPRNPGEQQRLLRGLMNIRLPQETDQELLDVQDAWLTEETKRKGVTDVDDLTPIRELGPATGDAGETAVTDRQTEELFCGSRANAGEPRKRLYLWQGDITTLRCDAIVNAANSGMTGCYVPNHRCIDNCIHTYAGMQLRQECARIMARQGREEPTGSAKITAAYNLPCRYILHTVGPIIYGEPTDRDCALLASCYRSCLELASRNRLESVAFCCISTGEFHFPNDLAAQIAVDTVTQFLRQKTFVKNVIFNVFKDTDRKIYEGLLRI